MPERTKFSREFRIDEFGFDDDIDRVEDWRGSPGFDESNPRGLTVSYDDDGGQLWSVAIVFHNRRDAEIAVRILKSKGLTPETYHALESTKQIRQEILESLPW